MAKDKKSLELDEKNILDNESEEFLDALADAMVDILIEKHSLTIFKKGVNT